MDTDDKFKNLFNNDNEFNVEGELDTLEYKKIHLRYQQRNKRKGITIIEGLDSSIDLKSFVKDIKKKFCCSGTIKNNDEEGIIIQFQGDHRQDISEILKNDYNINDITIHGA